ncbi:hypothetical protein DVH24_020517, partial [Malus domestica]
IINHIPRREEKSICHQIGCRNHRQVKTLAAHNFAAVLPGDLVVGLVVANGISNFLNLYNTLLVVRLVLAWFPNSPPAIVAPLSTISDPYLNIFRGLIPPLGGTLDLSPILAFLVLNALTSTAAALPAELPSSPASGASQQLVASPYWNYQPLYTSEEMVDEAPGQQQQHHEELRRCQLGLHCILLQYRVPNTNLPASPLFVLYLAEIEENFCLA